MKFSAIVAAATLAIGAVADSWSNCLSDAQVQDLINKEILYLQHNDIEQAREIANSIFTPDVMEYGDSINSLRYQPVSLPFNVTGKSKQPSTDT